ncbi:MAG: hypothetical protein SFY96_02370 [Planctomycetota bacterium]|nr:hypothetical protein [Planctomycetota bacterium]
MSTADRSALLAASRALQAEGRYADARDALKARLDDYQNDAEVQMEYATVLSGLIRTSGDFAPMNDAIAHARRAVELVPHDLPKRRGLFMMLEAVRRNTEALEQIRELRRQDPTDPNAIAGEAAILMNLLRFDESVKVFDEGVARFPLNRVLLARQAWCSNYVPGLDPAHSFAIHTQYGKAMRTLLPQRPVKYPNTPDPERRITLGLLSPDFRTHSCAFFLLPLLRSLDRTRVRVVCIHTIPVVDQLTQQFRTLADEFVHLPEQPPPNVAAAVRKAGVDVLIDLAGHSSGTGLPAMHLRPAPVQGTYLGYANTSGLDAIQFRLVDAYTDPAGAESRATERLVRLDPCFLCYQPPEHAGPTAPCPSDAAGHVTFGSFNSPIKLNDTIIALWTRVLRQMPDSRLILKSEALGDHEFAAIVRSKFVALGVDPTRIDLLGRIASITSHLDAYARIDIALDTFPYHGTTTTCEAMWMGVPVISRVGVAHASRVGLSLLSAVGLADLAADTDDAFVAAAIALAADGTRRRTLRSQLRATMQSSPLCDANGFAQRFEVAIREQWRAWCASQS